MLVLSRKVGEEILLPDQGVAVRVVGISGDRVRLGITAPAEIPIHRSEVWRRIQELRETIDQFCESRIDNSSSSILSENERASMTKLS